MAKNFCDNVVLERTSGRHLRVIMTGPKGVQRHVICSSTPSDWRTLANTARKMKVVAAEVGAYR